MKKRIRKSMAIILVMVMVTLSVPASIFAEEKNQNSKIVLEEEITEAVSTPTDAINFPDANLKKALLEREIDKNNDKFITKDELADVVWLFLSNEGITNLSGLEFAISLKTMNLSNNAGLTDLQPIESRINSLDSLDLYETGISEETRLSYVRQIDDIQLNKGVYDNLKYKPDGVLNGMGKNVSFKSDIVQVNSNDMYGIMIFSSLPGETTGTIKSGVTEKTFKVTVNDFTANQPIGTPVTELPKLAAGDSMIFKNNSELWEIKDKNQALIKEGIKDYQTRQYQKDALSPDLGLAIDNTNTLFLRDTENTLGFVSQVANINGSSVGEWAYENYNKSQKLYWDLALDTNKQLWIMDNAVKPREYRQSLSNVDSFSGQFALTTDNKLQRIYGGSKGTLLENVREFDYFMKGGQISETYIYSLKNDNTLWGKKPREETFTEIAQDVERLIKSDGKDYIGGFVKTNGTFWKFDYALNVATQVSESIEKQLGPFMIKTDGSTWYETYGNYSEHYPRNYANVLDREIKTYMEKEEYSGSGTNFKSERILYMVDLENNLWRFNTESKDSATKVGSNFNSFLKTKAWPLEEPTGYSDTQGNWFDLSGTLQTEANVVTTVNKNFDLKGDKKIYYRWNILLLDQVLAITQAADENSVYATRTDGTVWIVSMYTPPQKIDDGKTVTVIFNSNGGTMLNAQVVEKDGKLIKPAEPTKTGFVFAGWFKDEALQIPWDFEKDAVVAATTLYARWTSNTPTPMPPTPTPPSQPDINTDKAVEEIGKAPDGSTVGVEIKNNASIPKSILEAAKGKDIKVELDYGDYQWVIDGKTIGDLGVDSYDLNVEKIKDENLSDLVEKKDALQLEIKYSGVLPFSGTLSYPAGATLNGKTLYLYYYNEVTKKLEYKGESKVIDGNVTFVFDHASKYVLIETALEPVVTETKASYKTHIQDIGWKDWTVQPEVSGTSGRFLRMEAMNIKLDNPNVGIRYQTHVQNRGWNQGWKADGSMSGTEGSALRMEAVKVELTGKDAANYDVYYQVHAQNYGWLAWAKNGESSGSAGYALQLEGMRVVVVSKGEAPPKALAPVKTSTDKPFYEGPLKH